jgi:LrgB-like family
VFNEASVGDYVTRGVTLGANSSAIATALLLVSDPRAAALSSLSMSLFGTITVVLTSVPQIVYAIRALAGYEVMVEIDNMLDEDDTECEHILELLDFSHSRIEVKVSFL